MSRANGPPMNDDTLYNIMVVLGKIYNRQRSLQEFDSENAKLVMAETLAALELLLDLYGPQPHETPRKRGIIDGILGR